MKKKLIGICLITVCLLAGCGTGNKEKVITDDSKGSNVSADKTDDSGDSKDNETKINGYAFKSGDVEIVIDGKAKPCLDALGEPVSYFESPSCAFGDLDKVYTYSGFEIDTYSFEGVDYVSAVILQDDTVSTAEGICIGDTVDKVKSSYGSETSNEGDMLVYKKDEMKLCFLIKDDSVSSIQYLTLLAE